MTKPTTGQVQQWAAEAGFPPHIRAAGAGRELDRLVARAYAAGQADKPQSPKPSACISPEQVAAWAEAAGVIGVRTSPENEIGYRLFQELQRFAALVAAAEREECAKVVEDTDVEQFTYCMVLQDDGCATLANAAAAIRARSAAKEQP